VDTCQPAQAEVSVFFCLYNDVLYDSVVDPELLIPDPNLAFRKVQTFFLIEKKNPLYFANKFSVCGLDPKKVTAMVLCSS
jgi:hypothetical protein